MDRPLVTTKRNRRFALPFEVLREAREPLLIPRTDGHTEVGDGNSVDLGISRTNDLKNNKTRFRVVGGRVRIAERHAVVVTQVGQLSPALSPLVEVTVEHQHVDDGADVAAIAQRGKTEATTQRVNHRQVVGDVHSDDDVAIRPVLGEPICQDLYRLIEWRCLTHHPIGDAVDRRRSSGNGHARIDVRLLHQ
ncbi:MAG: hypothetical protein WA614_08320 [Acidimicrobiales bacterium]